MSTNSTTPPPLSFSTLNHALTRRTNDHRHFLPSIPPPTTTHTLTLTDPLSHIECAIKSSPAFLPLEVLNSITATLTQMQMEAVELGKDIEMNPMRVRLGKENAKSEEELDERRTGSLRRWKGVLDGVWEQILEKSERKLHKTNLMPVLEGKRAERLEGGELVWRDRGED